MYLDGNNEMSSVLQEILRVESDDTGLIRLSDISEDNVDHADQHSVFEWLSGVTDDWNNVESFLGHVDEVSSGSWREFNSINNTILYMALRD